METLKKPVARQHEITDAYLAALDDHLADIVSGKAQRMMEINEIAALLHIHPTHLSNTVRQTTGQSACHFFEEKILNIARQMLEKNEQSISSIAMSLTYDPSNFTKFFKTYMHQTPKQYREEYLQRQRQENSVRVTRNSVSVTKA